MGQVATPGNPSPCRMPRARDWWVQAEADLRHARHALEDEDYE
ncbi:HEPN domain-containing protein [Rhodothermus marinus]|nr:HEPN domain-containing protein [Rhodothermus marinus]